MSESYRITGSVRDEQGKPVEGFTIQAFDKKLGIYLHPDDKLGKATTRFDGSFEISFNKETFKDWLEKNPKIYLQVRNREGKIVVQSQAQVNTTGDTEFQIKLGEREIDPLDSNIYQNGLGRIVGSFRGMSGTVDMSRSDIAEVAEILFRAIDSWVLYRDELVRVAGYDGIKVPNQPRKEQHDHITRWDRPVLLS